MEQVLQPHFAEILQGAQSGPACGQSEVVSPRRRHRNRSLRAMGIGHPPRVPVPAGKVPFLRDAAGNAAAPGIGQFPGRRTTGPCDLRTLKWFLTTAATATARTEAPRDSHGHTGLQPCRGHGTAGDASDQSSTTGEGLPQAPSQY